MPQLLLLDRPEAKILGDVTCPALGAEACRTAPGASKVILLKRDVAIVAAIVAPCLRESAAPVEAGHTCGRTASRRPFSQACCQDRALQDFDLKSLNGMQSPL